MKSLRQDRFSNVRNDLLAGLVVALALIPEAIVFSIIAGVDPKVGREGGRAADEPSVPKSEPATAGTLPLVRIRGRTATKQREHMLHPE